MTFFERLLKIERMDWLISMESTGDPTIFARRVDTSVSTLYRLIKLLREMGYVVKYDKEKRSYYYVLPGKFKKGFHSTDSYNIQ